MLLMLLLVIGLPIYFIGFGFTYRKISYSLDGFVSFWIALIWPVFWIAAIGWSFGEPRRTPRNITKLKKEIAEAEHKQYLARINTETTQLLEQANGIE